MSKQERTRIGSLIRRLQREKTEVTRRLSDAIRKDDNVETTFLEIRLQKIGQSIEQLRDTLSNDKRARA